MSDDKIYPVQPKALEATHITDEKYQKMYQASLEQPEKFWSEQASAFLSWSKPWDSLTTSDMKQGKSTWFQGAELNASYNCIDRHLETRSQQTAIIWEGDDPGEKMTTLPTRDFMTKYVS